MQGRTLLQYLMSGPAPDAQAPVCKPPRTTSVIEDQSYMDTLCALAEAVGNAALPSDFDDEEPPRLFGGFGPPHQVGVPPPPPALPPALTISFAEATASYPPPPPLATAPAPLVFAQPVLPQAVLPQSLLMPQVAQMLARSLQPQASQQLQAAPQHQPLTLYSRLLLSAGSVGHAEGTCKPCAFVHRKGCDKGSACSFCHLCDSSEALRRKKGKRAAQVAEKPACWLP